MEYFETSDGLKLAYRLDGAGPPVLCLAGLTRDHHDFDEMIAGISTANFIRMDYRGRGLSDFDPDYRNYAVHVEARDAIELLDHLGIDRTAIIGTSRGGIIAMVLAARVRHRLSGVLLNDIGPELTAGGLERIKGYLGRNPGYKTHVEAAADLPRVSTGFAKISAARWMDEAKRLWHDGPKGLTIKYDPKLRDAFLSNAQNADPDLWPFFDAMNGMPLALLRGENSDLLSRETAEKMRKKRPDMLFAEVADRAHIPFLDEDVSVKLINNFIELTA